MSVSNCREPVGEHATSTARQLLAAIDRASRRLRDHPEAFCRPLRAAMLLALSMAIAAPPAQARQVLLVANGNTVGEYNATTGATVNAMFVNTNSGGGSGYPYGMALDGNHLFVTNLTGNTVGQYDATTGATINATFVNNGQGLNEPWGLALDRNNHHLFVANGYTVGEYDSTTGATINATFVNSNSGGGYGQPFGLAVDGNNHLFVANGNTVGEYDATTGATVNANFISLNDTRHAIALDARNHLLVANGGIVDANFFYVPGSGSIGEYDGTTGATVNANFVTGLDFPFGLALDGSYHLFAINYIGNTVGEYDATTGATINPALISGLNNPSGLLFVAPVPEPSSLLLLTGAAAIAVGMWRRRRAIAP